MRLTNYAPILCLNVFAIGWLVAPARAVVCATEEDRLVWARERMLPTTTTDELKELLRFLTDSSRRCASSGELWYYRGLVEKQLSLDPSLAGSKSKFEADSKYSLEKADRFKVKDLQERFNPFEIQKPKDKPLSPSVHEKYALIVGVNKFKNAGKEDAQVTINNLSFSVQDATELKQALIDKAGFKSDNVTLLTDEKATRNGIEDALGDIRQKAEEDDLVLLYFSSHGLPHSVDATGISYVATYDTDLAAGKQYSTAIEMLHLAEYSRKVKARRFVLLLDTCFSGAAASAEANARGVRVKTGGNEGAKAFTEALGGMAYAGSYIILTASRADEESFEDAKLNHGYFTYHLLNELNQTQFAAPLGTVFTSVKKQVTDAVSTNVHRDQHPVLDKNEGGEKIQLLDKKAQRRPPRGGRVIIVGDNLPKDNSPLSLCAAGNVCVCPGGSLANKDKALSELDLPAGKLDNWGYGYVLLTVGNATKELCPDSDVCNIDLTYASSDPKVASSEKKITLQIAPERGGVKILLPRGGFVEKVSDERFESTAQMRIVAVHSSQLDEAIQIKPGNKIEIFYNSD